jgi:hypothetical protein
MDTETMDGDIDINRDTDSDTYPLNVKNTSKFVSDFLKRNFYGELEPP